MTKPKPKTSTAAKADRKPRAKRQDTERAIDLAKAVNLALAGATFRQIATDLDVPEETVRHHLVSPEGQRALRYAVNDLQERTDRFLASAHLSAIRRLVREMEEAEKAGDRIRAAQAITMLAARRIEITGANGAPIEVDTTVVTLLDERIARMRERSGSIIDATGSRVLVESEAVEPPVLEADIVEIESPATIALPKTTKTDQDNQGEPSEIKTDKADSGEIKTDQGEPSATKTDQGEPSATKANQAKSSEAKTDKAQSEPISEIKTDKGESSDSPAPARPRTRQPAGLRPGQSLRAIR
jgi:predicted transcriptional regulator